MRVFIRVDASDRIGWGHARRCLALACELRRCEASVAFVSRAMDEALVEEARRSGIDVLFFLQTIAKRLRNDDAGVEDLFSAEAQAVDAAETLRLTHEWGGADVAIVDNYGLGEVWERLIRGSVRRIVVLDDLANRRHECDVLTDAAGSDDRKQQYSLLAPPGTMLLIGPRYALLRPEFSSLREVANRDGTLRRVFVSFGAVDAAGHSPRAVAVIRERVPDASIDVIVGPSSPHIGNLQRMAAADPAVHLHVGTPHVVRLMSSADLAVGAGGGTAWERAGLGLPSIVSRTAENQSAVVTSICDAGCAVEVAADSGFEGALGAALLLLRSNPALVRRLGQAGPQIVDGRGVARVRRAILPAMVTFRRATAEDAGAVWDWRNDARVRSVSRGTDLISWDEHRSWYSRCLDDPSRVLLIADVESAPTAVVRFDLRSDGKSAEVSIYLTPNAHSRGLGSTVIREAVAWLEREMAAVRWIDAHVRVDNVASARAFLNAGFLHSETIFTMRTHQHGS